MVKTKGSILPTSTDVLRDVPSYRRMMTEIMESCWGACVGTDPGPRSAAPPSHPYLHPRATVVPATISKTNDAVTFIDSDSFHGLKHNGKDRDRLGYWVKKSNIGFDHQESLTTKSTLPFVADAIISNPVTIGNFEIYV